MKLIDLAQGLDFISFRGNLDIEISNIAYDSRKVEAGSLFVCVEGFHTDGHRYIQSAVDKGASAIVVQRSVEALNDPACQHITFITVVDTRKALAHVSHIFFDRPSSRLQVVGVTGTNGKTTTTHMIRSILGAAGKTSGLIGTVANVIDQKSTPSSLTTPESLELQELFSKMVDQHIEHAVMEVSSQGLARNRVDYTEFDIGIFTNLTRDHIGPTEHKDMQDYLNAKARLFRMCKQGLINTDCEHSRQIAEQATCSIKTFAINQSADFQATDLTLRSDGSSFTIETPKGPIQVCLNMPGLFNIYNALAAAGACSLIGISNDAIRDGLQHAYVPGRTEFIETGLNFDVMIDYAHTPDSLEKILNMLKVNARGRIVCVFGCPGERDIEKRRIMGEISGRLADFTVVTTDNPKSEDPLDIIREIEHGLNNVNGDYISIQERSQAIRYALSNARPDDIVLLAGKGHETLQQMKNISVSFNERQIVSRVLDEMKSSDHHFTPSMSLYGE